MPLDHLLEMGHADLAFHARALEVERDALRAFVNAYLDGTLTDEQISVALKQRLCEIRERSEVE